jgi:methylated-DNA-protein-cysteine methyltransferase related protein
MAEDRIWLVLSRIPEGRVTTYGTVARLAGLPRHARLVGRTLAALPDDSRLPWHRVVNASRRLSPRGDSAAVAAQRQRLEAEGVRFSGDRVVAECFWQP